MLFQKQFASAPWREALDLSLRTLPEGAESAEIIIPSLAEQEDVNLMVGDSDTSLLKEIVDRSAAGAIEGSQTVEAIDRYREVDIPNSWRISIP
jgi:hypothetical protein